MPFDWIFTARAKKDLKRLDPPTARRILDKVQAWSAVENPPLEKLEKYDLYKLRVGDYRLVLQKLPANRQLFILFIDHRKHVYKRLQ